MATQLQRALGLADGKEPVPKKDAIKDAQSRQGRKPEKKGDGKADPYSNLPRRPFGIDKET